MACQPPRLPENTVEYGLYHHPDSVAANEPRKQLDQLIVQYCAHLAPFLADYIWQKESFSLRPIVNETGAFIYGRTTFEDNIEDEYFILFLLRQLTLFDSELVVKVADEDGEILLIESAQYLDKWAQDPSRTTNRVYLFHGEIHLVSPKDKPNWTEIDSRKFPLEAVCFILKNFAQTKCNDSIQQCLISRTKVYPANITGLQHRAHCYVPLSVASLLDHNPNLISNAVRAFYYRTPDDIKSIAFMKQFTAQNCILTNVKFTRCLYAQLTSQEYSPDKRSDWTIPPKDEANHAAHMNGFKIAAGFEILMTRFMCRTIANSESNENGSDYSNRQQWKRFLSCLEANGFFGGEPAGSELYNQKLQKGKLFFQRIVSTIDHGNSEYATEKEIHTYIESVNSDSEFAKRRDIPLEAEDDPSWLFLDQTELDQLLAEKFGCNSTANMKLEDISKSIPDTIKKFVFNENAGLEGAEAPRVGNKQKSVKSKIQVDEQEFANFVKEIQFLVEKKPNIDDLLDDDSTDSSSLDDYGSDNDDFDDIQNGSDADSSNDEACEENAYLRQMDSELAKTFVGKSFSKCAQLDSDDDEDSNQIDLNVLSNILESYSGEAEIATSAGPATALFSTMGTKLPDIEKKPN